MDAGPIRAASQAPAGWQLPRSYNIAEACADAWARSDRDRVALLRVDEGGRLHPTTYGDVARASDRLALALGDRGIARGDRVAILLPQSVAAVVGHFATYKLGAIVVPLAALFGADALRHRLQVSGAKALIADAGGLDRLEGTRGALPDLATILCVDGPSGDIEGVSEAMAATGDRPFLPAETGPDDPALMIFTSGTTGPPKGALHAHRVLIGHLPGFTFTHGAPRTGDRLWTPSDWAWAGGLLNCLLPGLALGTPVVFGPFRPFDPEVALDLMAKAGVTGTFLPPTALRMIRASGARPPAGLALRTIGAAGESLGRETLEWATAALGVPVNEFYGQTECNYVLGSSAAAGVMKPGAIGQPIPGHDVAVLADDGTIARPGEPGEIAIRKPDPAMFLGYWQDADATAAKFAGDWMLTGDHAVADADGFVTFVGRNDDIITSAGYRIGPAEIEDCLATHPATALAAVVGKPDMLRTEIVKAYVVLKPGYAPGEALAGAIRQHVRSRLSAAEYPREIAFVDAIPLTVSGKVIRRHFREIARREAEASAAIAPAEAPSGAAVSGPPTRSSS